MYVPHKKTKYITVNLLENPGHLNLEKDVTDSLNIRRIVPFTALKHKKFITFFQKKCGY